MKTYYTRDWRTNKLIAIVKANTYTEALYKTVGEKWSCLQKCRNDRYCEDTEGNKIPNYITFLYNDDIRYYIYHR